jgi:hypothetical protein
MLAAIARKGRLSTEEQTSTMIERLMPTRRNSETPSAFCRGAQERPLRITFHDSSFAGGSSETEAEALEALLQLAHLPQIEAFGTEAGAFPHLEIGDPADDGYYVPVIIRTETMVKESGAMHAYQWLKAAMQLSGQNDSQHPQVQAFFADLLVARAHHEFGQDILITLSPELLAYRFSPPVREANPRSPSEAARIVGLFLRSRDNYTYFASQRGAKSMNRGLFYWVLARHRLPSLWRYFSACVNAEKARGDDILYLGQSVLHRCVRALEARDAVGIQFYLPQNNDTRDAMMYHFDYLTLVLSGALDALARIAHRAYSISQPKERQAYWDRDTFQKALRKAGANDLYALVSEQHSKDVLRLVNLPRNTIHGAALPTFAARMGVKPEASFVTVLPQYRADLWNAAERCGPPERWGMTRLHGTSFEPYNYSVALVEETFRLVDSIAAATDVTGLFPPGYTVPELQDGPPADLPFTEATRLAILG